MFLGSTAGERRDNLVNIRDLSQQEPFDKSDFRQIFFEYPLYHFFRFLEEKKSDIPRKIEISELIQNGNISVSFHGGCLAGENQRSFFLLEFRDERAPHSLVFSRETCTKLPYGAMTVHELGRKVAEYISLCGDNKVGQGIQRILFDEFVDLGARPFARSDELPATNSPVFKPGTSHNGSVENNVELLKPRPDSSSGLFSLRVFFSSALSPSTVRFRVVCQRTYYEFPLPVEYTRRLTLDEMVERLDYAVPLAKEHVQDFFAGFSSIENMLGVLPKEKIPVILPVYFKAWDIERPTFFVRNENQRSLLLSQRDSNSPICATYEKKEEAHDSTSGDFWGRVILSGALPKKTWNVQAPFPKKQAQGFPFFDWRRKEKYESNER